MHTTRRAGASLRPDAEQARAASLRGQRLIVLTAPPGAGKTATLVARYCALVDEGARPEHVAVASFTRAAREAFVRAVVEAHPSLADRIADAPQRRDRPPAAPATLWIGTFHDIALRVLRLHPREAGYTEPPVVLGEESSRLRLASALEDRKALPVEGLERERTLDGAWRTLRRWLDAGIDPCAPHEAGLKSAAVDPERTREPLRLAFDTWERAMLRDGYCSVGDVVARVWRLMRRFAAIRRAWEARFDHVMVDEAQDSAPIELALLAVLARHAELVLSGDEEQAIYGWRGAVPATREVKRFAPTHGAPYEVKLRHDYRLGREIQQAAARLQRAMPGAGEPAAPGTKSALCAPTHVTIPGHRESNGIAQLLEEVRDLATRTDGGAPPPWRSFALGARRNDTCRELAQALREGGIPAHVHGRPTPGGASDLLGSWCLAAAALGEGRVEATERAVQALRGAPFEVPQPWLDRARVEAARTGRAPSAVLADDAQAPATVRDAARTLDALAQRIDRPAREWLAEAHERLHFAETAAAASPDERAAARRGWSTAWELAGRGLSGAELAETLDTAPGWTEDPDEDAVHVATFHGLKGREWAHVVAAGWYEGGFPFERSRNAEEDLRLAYMVMTRAERSFHSTQPETDFTGRRLSASRYARVAGLRERTLERSKADQ